MDQLAGRVAVVTGGARGLGEAISRELASAGMSVVIADRRAGQGEQLAASLKAAGHTADFLRLDVTDEQAAEAALAQVVLRHGRLDVLVNNAGTDQTLSVEEISVADWKRVIEVNLVGAFLMAKFALPHMKQQGGGQIINIVSTAAKRAWPNASAYHASKWGLLGFRHALHTEARPLNIRVTALVAGGMATPFLLERFPYIDRTTLQDPGNVARAVRMVLSMPPGTVIPELMVIPMKESSWP